MSGKFLVFDESIFKLMGSYETEGAALDYVAALIRANSEDYADELIIVRDDADALGGDELLKALHGRQLEHERVAVSVTGD